MIFITEDGHISIRAALHAVCYGEWQMWIIVLSKDIGASITCDNDSEKFYLSLSHKISIVGFFLQFKRCT